VHSDPLGPLERLLEEGRSILIFPEGTRGTDEVVAFRSGLFHLARRFPDVDMVPIYLANLSRILPKGSWLLCQSMHGALWNTASPVPGRRKGRVSVPRP
jgi:1-acyl-sn-glycerol-3-phosphate acyltransferase